MLRSIFIFCIIACASCADPWSVNIEADGYKIRSSTATDYSVHAAFYKRLLNVIVSRTVVENEESPSVVGSLSLLAKKSDWETLKRYLEQDTAFNGDDLRKIDQILFQSIKEEPIVVKYSKSVYKTTKNFVTSYYKTIIIGLLSALALYKIRNKNIRIFLNKRNIIILLLFIIIGWEYMIVYDEYDENYYVSSNRETAWKKYFHPLYVAKRLSSRVLYGNVKDIFHVITNQIDHISETSPYFFQTPVRIFLNLSLLFLIINLLFAFIFNILLNRPYSINFLMFAVDLKEKFFHSQKQKPPSASFDNISHTQFNTNNGDKISGENLNTLLKIMHRTTDRKINNTITEVHFRSSRSECRVDGKIKPRRVNSESRLSTMKRFL